MYITNKDLSDFAGKLNKKLKELRKKINFYSDTEIKKRGRSNFSLGDISEDIENSLTKVETVLLEYKIISIETPSVSDLKEKYKEYLIKFKEFDELCDSIYNSAEGSMNRAFFYLSFSDWFTETYQLIMGIYDQFLEKFEIEKIISEHKKYEQILNDAKAKEKEMQNVLNSIKTKSDTLLLKLEQNVAEHEILDIKEYYTETKEIIRKEKNLYGWGFLISSLLLIACLICLFIFLDRFFPKDETHLIIPRSVLSCSFLGVFTFLINDFRKRFNICKNILDELNQKVIVVNTYTSLLSRIKDFDDETKKKYHDKIIQNIIDTLLLVRNHGYLSKILNQSDPNLASKIIEELGSIIPKTTT